MVKGGSCVVIKTGLLVRGLLMVLAILNASFAFGQSVLESERSASSRSRDNLIRELGTVLSGKVAGKVVGIEPGQSTRKQVREVLGFPQKGAAKNREVFRVGSNRVTVGYQKNTVRYVEVYLVGGLEHHGLSLKRFLPFIPDQALKQARGAQEKQARVHEKGRDLEVVLPDSGLMLTFREAEDPLLKSILLWEKGAPRP